MYGTLCRPQARPATSRRWAAGPRRTDHSGRGSVCCRCAAGPQLRAALAASRGNRRRPASLSASEQAPNPGSGCSGSCSARRGASPVGPADRRQGRRPHGIAHRRGGMIRLREWRRHRRITQVGVGNFGVLVLGGLGPAWASGLASAAIRLLSAPPFHLDLGCAGQRRWRGQSACFSVPSLEG